MGYKTFVTVVSTTNGLGQTTPLSLIWEDGRIYRIDRILEVRRAASRSAGGKGIRYTCQIRGKTTYLFYEAPRWFVEAKSDDPPLNIYDS